MKQKWGVRRYQNPDGSLTPEGREHYGVGLHRVAKELRGMSVRRANRKAGKAALYSAYAKNTAQRAKESELAKGEKYLNAKSKYDKAARKLYNAKNGVYANVVGSNGRKVRKLEDKLKKYDYSYQKALNEYDRAKDIALSAELYSKKMSDLYERKNAKAIAKGQSYIKKYDKVEYGKLFK